MVDTFVDWPINLRDAFAATAEIFPQAETYQFVENDFKQGQHHVLD